jgi:hypothetical protein
MKKKDCISIRVDKTKGVQFFSDGTWKYFWINDSGEEQSWSSTYRWHIVGGRVCWSCIVDQPIDLLYDCRSWRTTPPIMLRDVDKKLLEYIVDDEFEKTILS